MLFKTSHLLICLAALSVAPSVARAQMFFEADFVTLNLDDGSSSQFIAGPDPFSAESASSFKPGYRLTLGGDLGDYEIYAMFTQTDKWSGSGQITLANPLVLDEHSASPFVAPANVLAFRNALFDAATISSVDPALNEANEIELLQSGAVARYQSSTDYRDFEINLGTSRNVNPWRAAIGYRHIRLNGDQGFAVAGTFDALDVADGAIPGVAGNDPNDGLAFDSFLSAGFLQTGGGGGFDAAASAAGPDIMTIVNSTQAHNELNGAQVTLAYRPFAGDWFTLDAVGKAGLYYNSVRGSISEIVAGSGNANAVFERTFEGRRRTAAFAGGLGLRGGVSLTDYINLVGGYEVNFLSGVGVSGEQASGVSRDLLGNLAYGVTTGTMIIHGANVGLEVFW
jgi:hypothetical protein